MFLHLAVKNIQAGSWSACGASPAFTHRFFLLLLYQKIFDAVNFLVIKSYKSAEVVLKDVRKVEFYSCSVWLKNRIGRLKCELSVSGRKRPAHSPWDS